jgi:protein-disulfide isomerase
MSNNQEKKLSKRQALRLERQKKQRQQRIITIGAIVAVALVLVLLFAVPTIQSINAFNEPVGDFVQITPKAWPDMVDGRAIGDPNAPAKIEVFEDFQCSACRGYTSMIEPVVISELVETGQAYYIFYNYPFMDDRSNIKDSDNAAMGSMCAAEQGMFWDFKALLYENYGYGPGGYSDSRLLAFAESLGMNGEEFSACLRQNRYKDQIDEDLALGNAYGVTGTPSVFVNGVIVKPGYVPSFEEIQAAVNDAIASR